MKNELMGAEGAEWMVHCKRALFGVIFRVPVDLNDLMARHDAIVSACNLLLFLTLRKGLSDEDRIAVERLRSMYLPPLVSLCSEQMRRCTSTAAADVAQHNAALKLLNGGLQMDEDSLCRANAKVAVNAELILSIAKRIEDVSSD